MPRPPVEKLCRTEKRQKKGGWGGRRAEKVHSPRHTTHSQPAPLPPPAFPCLPQQKHVFFWFFPSKVERKSALSQRFLSFFCLFDCAQSHFSKPGKSKIIKHNGEPKLSLN